MKFDLFASSLLLACSTDLQGILIQEAVLWHFQVVGSWPFSRSPRSVIMAPMTGTEPSMIVSSIWKGDTAKVSADPHNNQPLYMCRMMVRSTILLYMTEMLELVL